MGLMGGRNKQKLLTPITNMATQRFDHTWLLANRHASKKGCLLYTITLRGNK